MPARDSEFPVAKQKLHRNQIIDDQLNRWHSYAYRSLDDIREAARRIETLADRKSEMVRQAAAPLRSPA